MMDYDLDEEREQLMSRNETTNLVILVLAIVGFFVLAGPLLNLALGLGGLLLVLLLWMVSGVLAGRFIRGEGYSMIGNIGFGIIGGIVGTWLFGLLGLGWINAIPFLGQILVGAVGAVIFIYVVRIFNSNFGR